MEITRIRAEISKIDLQIIHLLQKRFQLIPQLVKIKQNDHLPIFQPEREQEMFEHYSKLAQEYGLNPEFVHDLFALIIIEMKNQQRIKSINQGKKHASMPDSSKK
ncbi:MAG: chorismate mutase [Candidatus Lokiarchaeota archaeon]|nr:chorismate mutase [Candidatus Harpocratesius repetitus]